MPRIGTVCASTEPDLLYYPMTSWLSCGQPSAHLKAPIYEQHLVNFPSHCEHLCCTCFVPARSLLTIPSRVILKIFTAEFYSIGALFAVYGAGILLISFFRRQQGNKQFFSEVGEDGIHQKKFRTSGNVVAVLTALSMAAYGCLLGLTLKLET